MPDKIIKPYGLWDSPITPASLALGKRLQDVQYDADSGALVWLEGRSDRGVLVAQAGDDAPRDLTEAHNVRAMVGYGGGDFAVAHGHVYYAEKESGRLYRVPLGAGAPRPITPPFGAAASPTPSPDGRWVVYAHQEGRTDGLAIVDVAGTHWPQKLAYGADFYMQPAWHPTGRQLAWVEWDHPAMPWDSTRLVLGAINEQCDVLPHLIRRDVIGQDDDVAFAEPRFTPDGTYLLYLCDRSGWTNLYRYNLATGEHRPLTDDRADIGRLNWAQGIRSYVIHPDGRRVYYLRSHEGVTQLWSVSIEGGDAAPVTSALSAYTSLMQPTLAPHANRLAVIASAVGVPPRVVSIALGAAGAERVHAYSMAERVPAAYYSEPRPVQWRAADGDTVHGLYYPPHHPDYASPGKPPLIVLVHGGPTGQSSVGYNAAVALLTTRGYAALAVNYRGSSGYGKAYLRRLRGMWGVYDVQDTVDGARHLVEAGLADPARLVVMGGSAGGFTVLVTLMRHPGMFKAGICSYGISNLFTLAADTHKFEERYLDSLIGPLPDAAALYRERSAIYHADRIVDPVAIFQGDIDRVVPRAQSDEIVASLQRRGVPHEYHVYEGEGHGWRKAETIERFYAAVLRFLRQYVIYS